MPYTCMNTGIKLNVRADQRAQRRSANKVESGMRWEFVRGMYGNVYEVIDHERFNWYRQDRPVDGQGDIFDGFLPFQCDYCRKVVESIKHVQYKANYWYYVRPNKPTAEWKQSTVEVKYSSCEACQYGPLPFPTVLIGFHMTDLYQDGILIYVQERRF
ncbi:hypothetical protein M2444_004597 [Paenibacillus sp. PastF-3]|uniref:hypothetical protein n=1 Tax=Paenibacillus sp. PastF-3 TaxID=2940626 RepID=UPI0024760609|nr:hypothetical protein [Paenibacillus sp. PastF-3]MDH6372768.1 hypothetical protein [Paenibacillus sp. PastF-3]